MKKIFFIYLLLFGFLLNFAWEVSQMPLFSSMGLGGNFCSISFFVLAHWAVTFLDVLGIFAFYSLISFSKKDWLWARRFNNGWVALLILLPLAQWLVEYHAVYIAHAWSYAPSMPLIFGVGILPLLQMSILPSISIILAKKACGDNLK